MAEKKAAKKVVKKTKAEKAPTSRGPHDPVVRKTLGL